MLAVILEGKDVWWYKEYCVCLIILPIVLRSLWSEVAIGVKVWKKLRVVLFLLGICFRAAWRIDKEILCQVVSRDSWVVVRRGVLFEVMLRSTWLENSSHNCLFMSLY